MKSISYTADNWIFRLLFQILNMNEGNRPDNILLQEISMRNSKALGELYDRYAGRLYKYGRKLTADAETVEDCIHDVFVKIWTNSKFSSTDGAFQFYLFKSFKNTLIDRIKLSRQKSHVPPADLDQHLWEDSFLELLVKNQIVFEISENLKKAINSLPDRQREAIFLHFIEGFGYDKVAQLMDIKIESAYNLTSKAIHHLQIFLKAHSGNVFVQIFSICFSRWVLL